ncbi:hypothetical protein ABKV19_004122 [Rosa sericea]
MVPPITDLTILRLTSLVVEPPHPSAFLLDFSSSFEKCRESTSSDLSWQPLELHMFVTPLFLTERYLEGPLPKLFQTRDGGKKLTRNSRPGLALQDLPLS